MLAFKDFAPARSKAGWISYRIESLEAALAAANAWIAAEGVVPIHVETVILPNMWEPGEHGPSDPETQSTANAGLGTIRWYQFFRVWYDTAAPRQRA